MPIYNFKVEPSLRHLRKLYETALKTFGSESPGKCNTTIACLSGYACLRGFACLHPTTPFEGDQQVKLFVSPFLIDLWLDYIRLEMAGDDTENVSKLHWRAMKSLFGENVEQFVTKYTLLNSPV